MARLEKCWENGTLVLRCTECGYEFLPTEPWRGFHYCYNCGAKLSND